MSPALAGGFLTTAPPGKPSVASLFHYLFMLSQAQVEGKIHGAVTKIVSGEEGTPPPTEKCYL